MRQYESHLDCRNAKKLRYTSILSVSASKLYPLRYSRDNHVRFTTALCRPVSPPAKISPKILIAQCLRLSYYKIINFDVHICFYNL